jgi:DhnA family fructose-bisphosphate aldolase class Ia
MDGKAYRLREFIRADGRSIVVDTSAGLSLGALPRLEQFEQTVRPLLAKTDGVVCSPGQIRRIQNRNRDEAGLLVRMDWTNTLRPVGFPLPLTQAQRVSVLTPQDAVDLGAVAMVGSFLLGYEEEIEAECLRQSVQWAMEGSSLGLPLVVEVFPTGPRVTLPDKAVELGASYALEAGADAVVVPYPGTKSLETIAQFVSVPWFVRLSDLSAGEKLDDALKLGAHGVWLGSELWANADPNGLVEKLWKKIHLPVAA